VLRRIDEARKKNPNYLKAGKGEKVDDDLPEDLFDAVIFGVEEMDPVEDLYHPGETKINLKFWFKIKNDKDFEGRVFSTLFTKSIHEKSNLYPVIKNVFGDIEDGLDRDGLFDFTKLIGLPCRVKITHNKRGYPKAESVMGPSTRDSGRSRRD